MAISKDLKDREKKTREDGVFTLKWMRAFRWRCW